MYHNKEFISGINCNNNSYNTVFVSGRQQSPQSEACDMIFLNFSNFDTD